jgi:sugar phosphate isomerase/epimerase
MQRRQFLRAAALAPVLGGVPPAALAGGERLPFIDSIGLGLFTLRQQLREDLPGTLRAVAEMGYKQVETFAFPDQLPMVKVARECGLEVHSAHFTWNSVFHPGEKGSGDKPAAPFEKVLEAAQAGGLSHLVVATIEPRDRTNLDGYRWAAEKCNRAAEQAKAAGIRLSYHNHSFEFDPQEGGKAGYDVLVEECSPDVHFEVDVFWVAVGKRDPEKLIRSLAGRVSQIHVKDLRGGVAIPDKKIDGYWDLPPEAFADLGQGVLSVSKILAAAAESGAVACHVEQDVSPDPLGSCRTGLAYLRGLQG